MARFLLICSEPAGGKESAAGRHLTAAGNLVQNLLPNKAYDEATHSAVPGDRTLTLNTLAEALAL